MSVSRPLRAVLFSFDVFRLVFVAAVAALYPAAHAGGEGGLFPNLVYLSSNALFPLMSFFLFLNLQEHHSYLPLYMAGKTMAVILFYVWAAFLIPPGSGFTGRESFIGGLMVLGGIFFISLGDALSVFGIWVLYKKIPRQDRAGSNGGL